LAQGGFRPRDDLITAKDVIHRSSGVNQIDLVDPLPHPGPTSLWIAFRFVFPLDTGVAGLRERRHDKASSLGREATCNAWRTNLWRRLGAVSRQAKNPGQSQSASGC